MGKEEYDDPYSMEGSFDVPDELVDLVFEIYSIYKIITDKAL